MIVFEETHGFSREILVNANSSWLSNDSAYILLITGGVELPKDKSLYWLVVWWHTKVS